MGSQSDEGSSDADDLPHYAILMDRSLFSSPAWYHALTLAERIDIIANNGSFHASEVPNNESALHLQRWLAEPQFAEASTFNLRLAQAGIDEKQLSAVLSERVERLQQTSQEPAWLRWLAEGYSFPATAYASPPPGAEELYFLDLIQPLIDLACEQLFAGLDKLLAKWPEPPFDPQTITDILLINLVDPLLIRLGRTMVLELNVARLQGQLGGETPAERFRSFVEQIRQPDEAVSILLEYPVLAQQIVICLNQWVNVCLEFLGRLCRDWPLIIHTLCQDADPGFLVELAGGAGDTHREGRSVMIAQFESGLHLVYKPKSLAVDTHFQELLAWLNDRGCDPGLRTLHMIDRGDYGWVEYVSRKECQTRAEVERFYTRLGLYLALLYAINASDFHLENLIACGEHPLLIDLETLFNPEFEQFEEEEAVAAAEKRMLNSVLVVGMLPQRLWSQDAYTGIDISGLGGEAGQLSPDRIPQPAEPGTDQMRYIRERLEMSGEANRPALNGRETSAVDYIPQVIDGFRSMFDILLDNRLDLLADSGPLAKFSLDETRVLLRPTRTYDQLLFESFHPDVLRDALQRDLLFDRLWVVVPGRPFMTKAIAAEQQDLRRGDIPVFTTQPASLILYSAAGDPIKDVLNNSGLAISIKRIRHLDEEERRRQEWFIRSSLATLTPYEYGRGHPSPTHYQLQSPQGVFSPQRLADHARDVADKLAATAVHGQDDVTWIGLDHLDEGIWDLAPLGMDLYNGVPGIALFLAYAGMMLREERYTTLARKAAAGILRHLDRFRSDLPGIGAYEGWGGILFALTHLAQLWDDDDLLLQADAVVGIIGNYIDEDENYAIFDGAAGAIGALLAYHHISASADALAAAVSCGDHLLRTAQTVKNGLGWVVPRFGPQPQLGFAHGAAGIAWALYKLADAASDVRYFGAAGQALAYERGFFSSSKQNWPDLRQSSAEDGSEPYHTAWCSGACGIGLSRLALKPLLEDTQLESEISAARQSTIKQGFGQSHAICHGDFGNLELLLTEHLQSRDSEQEKQLKETAAMILDSVDRAGWQCGGPGAVELPGLMIGIAGIGYQMLRLANPEKIPSILLLAPPKI